MAFDISASTCCCVRICVGVVGMSYRSASRRTVSGSTVRSALDMPSTAARAAAISLSLALRSPLSFVSAPSAFAPPAA